LFGVLVQIQSIRQADLPDVDLSQLGVTRHGSFTVEVIDPVADYIELLQVRRRGGPCNASGT
jgi:phosphoglucomutase